MVTMTIGVYLWKLNLLRSKEYWSLVETGYAKPAKGVESTEVQKKELKDLMMKDLKVKNYPFQAIDRTILEQILEKRTAKQIWDSMKKKFEGNARVKRSTLQALGRDFEVLEMKVGEIITEYFTRVMAITNKMRSNGEDMKERMRRLGFWIQDAQIICVEINQSLVR
ncbi:gag-polypeptide of LTR copia-type [Sesbania bispinosa]|nr:gag-polypeptide of LTR copia-type [Sesbania bispinosa]